MKHRGWIILSGLFWFAIGIFLLNKGLRFIAEGVANSSSQAGMALIAVALFIGFLKGRIVLAKTVKRLVSRILALQAPIRFADVYPRSYFLLIAGMVGLGALLRFLPISIEARGFVDVAIGSALINGAMLYFRAASNMKTSHL